MARRLGLGIRRPTEVPTSLEQRIKMRWRTLGSAKKREQKRKKEDSTRKTAQCQLTSEVKSHRMKAAEQTKKLLIKGGKKNSQETAKKEGMKKEKRIAGKQKK